MVKEDNHEPKWWDYVKEVHSQCFGFISESCSLIAQKKIGIDHAKVDKCVKDSFETSNHQQSDNVILKEMSQAWKDYGTLYWPSVTINRMTFRGDITPENILQDVCANLIDKPKVCVDFYKREGIKVEEISVQGPDTVSAELLILVVCVLVGVNVILILAYRRCVKKEMEDTMGFKVSSAVNQYIAVAQNSRQN